MNSKKILTVLLLAVMTLGAFAQQKITVKVGSVCPANSPWELEQKKIADEWRAETNGLVDLVFMNATAIGGEKGVIQKMTVNVPGRPAPLDGGVFTNIGVRELAPESDVLTLCMPFTFKNQDEISYVIEKTADHVNKAVEAKGFKLLGWFNVGMAYFYTKKEVRTPDQLKHVSLSVGGMTSPEFGRAFQYAGYTTSDVPNEKLLASLKSDTGCGGLYSITLAAYAAQYTKYAKYVLDLPLCPVMAGFVISQKTWDSIPDQYKPAMIATIKKAEKAFIRVQQQTDKEYLSKIAADGGVIVKLTPAEEKVFRDNIESDVIKMANSKEVKIIDYDFFMEIKKLLEEYRGR